MTQLLSKPFFVRLPHRGQVRIGGADRLAFLQNLASNDMRLLDSQPAVYSCLLTPQGKFMHDFFVTQDGETLFLECEGAERAEDLLKKLKPFKLRSKVDLSFEADVPVYVTCEGTEGYTDPRHASLGRRVSTVPANVKESSFEQWDQHRIRLGVPDGSRDMIVDKDTLLECNMDKLHGVSLNKGCYVGQEITARMHLRGLVKKHLYTVIGKLPEPLSDITINGQLVGQMRSRSGDIGLAMLKDDALAVLDNEESPIRLLSV